MARFGVSAGFSIALLLLGVSGLSLNGCAHGVHAPSAASVPAVEWPVKSPDFIDILPGVVREVTPIFTSGGFLAQQDGAVITLDGTDFEGYETALYTLKPRAGGGVDTVLTSVEVTKGNQTTPAVKPRVLLFQFPRRVRYIRMLYLLRVSGSDHNMAILASNDVDHLNLFTKEVQADPEKECRNARRAYCSWVPQGIAVTANPGR